MHKNKKMALAEQNKFEHQQKEKLSPKQEEQARTIHQMIGEPLIGSYGQFMFKLFFESNPEKELVTYSNIALSIKIWRTINPNYTEWQEREVFDTFLKFSMGIHDEDKELMAIYLDKGKEV